MTFEEAKSRCQERWLPSFSRVYKCGMRLDDSATQEFPWGWLFTIVPMPGEKVTHSSQSYELVFLRDTGRSMPVGFKGLRDALARLKINPDDNSSETGYY